MFVKYFPLLVWVAFYLSLKFVHSYIHTFYYISLSWHLFATEPHPTPSTLLATCHIVTSIYIYYYVLLVILCDKYTYLPLCATCHIVTSIYIFYYVLLVILWDKYIYLLLCATCHIVRQVYISTTMCYLSLWDKYIYILLFVKHSM
jgi:hypothetical protein